MRAPSETTSTGRPRSERVATPRKKNAARLPNHPSEQRRVTRNASAQKPLGAK